MTRKEVEAKVAAGESLSGADLSEANLIGAILRYADLRYADLRGANLSGADLGQANLSEANLSGAYLHGANLIGANLIGADLGQANLSEANLIEAILREAILREAILRYADLRYADLRYADLSVADLTGAILREAKLRGADLSGAKLRGADLTGANLRKANLLKAYLREANLSGADLHGANLSSAILSAADLSEANLQDATWDDSTAWPEGFEPPLAQVASRESRSLGRKAAPLLKFQKPETPRSAREFKKSYPAEFESLKAMTGGRDFSDALVQELRGKAQTPFQWAVTGQKYRSASQRMCPGDNEVLLLNVAIDERYTPKQQKVLNALREVSRRSGHPVERKPFFTIGWVRYCVDDEQRAWLIEEVQSDVGGVRKGLMDAGFRDRLAAYGMSPEETDDAVALLVPYAERFYEDALGLLFELAAEKGYSVEMLDYADKQSMGSPRNVYTDLPRSMGMKLSSGSKVLPGLATSWKITPNRKRTSRSPKRSSRRPRRTSRR